MEVPSDHIADERENERYVLDNDAKEVSARASESLPSKVGHQRSPMFPKNVHHLISLPCSAMDWEQPMGSVASVQMPQWISQCMQQLQPTIGST